MPVLTVFVSALTVFLSVLCSSIIAVCVSVLQSMQGRIQEFAQGGGLNFFNLSRGAQHPLGPKKPLKSIDFTGPGGA